MRTVKAITLSAATLGLLYVIGCQPTTTTGSPTQTATPGSSSTPTPTPNGVPLVPASHKYYVQAYTNCLQCHTDQKPSERTGKTANGNDVPLMSFPSDHKGRSDSSCLSCHTKAPDLDPPVVNLDVVRVGSAPTIDGVGTDTAWDSATEATIHVSGGINHSETDAKIKAVHDGTNVYFRMTWADPTQSLERGPYVKGSDGKWTATSFYPNSYEDKVAMIWNNPDHPIANFNTQGCAVTCHAVTAYGRPLKYTNGADEIGDMWHAKMSRHVMIDGINQMDDQRVFRPADIESTTPSAGTIEDGGRGGDPQTTLPGGDRIDNPLVDGVPAWMPTGGTKWAGIGAMTATESMDTTKYVAGDKVPRVLAKRLTEGRGDIAAKAKWANGTWTMEWTRALVPTDVTSGKDVKFEAGKSYYFGLAVFDNNQIGHAVQFGVTKANFAQ